MSNDKIKINKFIIYIHRKILKNKNKNKYENENDMV